jgi:hypothetical protein
MPFAVGAGDEYFIGGCGYNACENISVITQLIGAEAFASGANCV